MINIIWTGIGVLLILWLLGFSINIGGGLIHLLLVLAVIGIVYNIFIGRRII
ncbi:MULTISPECIES: lmo0937 family membrane protein [unclassified Pseudanabaena]|uniref:lmo0937 family membrane protein n=1 Tax=unclassified Pseudanabaena TaxID=2593292 RepID=UPI000B0EB4AC|nr:MULTISPECIES: lmo0937 family membrane protein [unclassified Pseudanabaena]TYQ26262.1 lmo0937 family membrane protein [Pseudanabaena sp. UWO310]